MIRYGIRDSLRRAYVPCSRYVGDVVDTIVDRYEFVTLHTTILHSRC